MKRKDINQAYDWRRHHIEHVDRLVANAGSAYEPSGSDVSRPEMWKGEHWKWLNERVLAFVGVPLPSDPRRDRG